VPRPRIQSRARLVVALVAAALVALTGATTADAAPDCPSGFACSRVPVPLDRSGQVPGTVNLFVVRQKASMGAGKPLLFVLNGGPGGASVGLASAFADSLKPALKRYQLVGYDPRGTGRSGVVDCPGLQELGEVASLDQMTAQFGACGGEMGDRAGLYNTDATVEDIDAIRAALGADKIAMLGVSYGTHVIQRYALAHPDRLERAVLDSPVAPGGVNALQLDSFKAVPRVLGALAPDAIAQTAKLVRRLPAHPVVGRVDTGSGTEVRRLTQSFQLDNILGAGDYSAFLRGQYPAAVRAANNGWPTPLLRLDLVANQSQQYPISDVSFGDYAATICADTTLPWAQSSDPATRGPLFDASVDAVTDASVAPFDRAAVRQLAVSGPCRAWPATSATPDTPPDSYPDVPAITLVGLSDLRTPLENAKAVQARWPGSGVITVKGSGHGVFQTTPCVTDATVRFLRTGTPRSAACRSTDGLDEGLARYPERVTDVAPIGGRGRAAHAFAAGLATFRDAQGLVFGLGSEQGQFGGLRGGDVLWARADDSRVLRLRNYAYLPGVRLTGALNYGGRGHFRVQGRVHGTLDYDGGWTGHFGGRTLVEHR
jgi:pimeloyl-ACP methyl ester carboxylesterase